MPETVLRAPVQLDSARRGGAADSVRNGTRRKFRFQVGYGLENLPTAWLALQENGVSSPFQSQSWLLPWYRIVGPRHSAKPLFVTVADAHTGEPLMFFPLCIRPEGKLTTIEFPDLGVSDYNAPLFAAHFEPDELQLRRILRGVFTALPSADLLRLGKMPETLGSIRNPLVRHEMFHRMRFQSWGVDLPNTRAQFDDSLQPSFRKELQRKNRRLAGRGEARFMEATTELDARRLYAVLVDQRKARFGELGRDNILDDPVYAEFYETVILSSLRNGFASLSSLQSDDETVAVLFGLKHAGAYHLLMSTMQSGKWKSCSPGNVAINSMISAMIEHDGRYFDFTIGDESYKRDFGARSCPLYECVRAQSIFGVPVAFGTNFKSVLRNRLRPAAQ